MKINIRWIVKNVPIWLLILIVITLIAGGFEGVINGMIFGQFPNLVGKDANTFVHFLIKSTLIFFVTYTAIVLQYVFLNRARKILRVKLKKTMLINSFALREDAAAGLNHISNDASKIDDQYFSIIAGILSSGAAAIISTIYVLQVNLLMGIIFIAFSCLSLVPMLFGKKKLGALGKEWSDQNSKMMQSAGAWFHGLRDILQYQVQKQFFKRVSTDVETSENTLLKQQNLQWGIQYFNFLLTIVAVVGPWALGFYFISTHQFGVTISALLSLTLSANSVVQNFRQLMQYWSSVASTTEIRKINVSDQDIFTQSSSEVDQPEIKFADVSLTYQDKPVYEDVNLDLPYGTKVLLQGPSGSGKSTLLNMVSGFLKPTKGEITVGSTAPVPSNTVYIAQTPWIFEGSIRDNLSLGQEFSDKQLLAALKQVGLDQEFGQQPLERMIHPDQEDLSGGQRQRLVIARALLRDRPIILLDEITAALDEQNANDIRQILYNTPKTVIESAHHINFDLAKKYGFSSLMIKDHHLVKE
ncbi:MULTISPECIES: ABC transporter ATP-binding protein [Lactobacillus]|uniref:ABC transporter ATP-binding protein n=1 Tax=Lactobacillus xujianguonis TaxID=2495899 RepID=A0A437STI2_9LACO|nr:MULTISPECIES: ABC transporter ATP-binding protein [Lactobacillus]RVU70249.1 ABC transporter ATP-binding protein [Lactobacillus xujianguonis]RVU73282.1 ABC transporter ATP-binding protein [Lactobacillus xujianguonis]